MATTVSANMGKTFGNITLGDKMLLQNDLSGINIKGNENLFGKTNKILIGEVEDIILSTNNSTIVFGNNGIPTNIQNGNIINIIADNGVSSLIVNKQYVDSKNNSIISEQIIPISAEVSAKVFMGNNGEGLSDVKSLSIITISESEYQELETKEDNAVYIVTDAFLDAGGKQIHNVATPLVETDGANAFYVLSNVANLSVALSNDIDAINLNLIDNITFISSEHNSLSTNIYNDINNINNTITTNLSNDIDTLNSSTITSIDNIYTYVNKNDAYLSNTITSLSTNVNTISTNLSNDIKDLSVGLSTAIDNKVNFNGSQLQTLEITSVTQSEYDSLDDDQKQEKLFIITDAMLNANNQPVISVGNAETDTDALTKQTIKTTLSTCGITTQLPDDGTVTIRTLVNVLNAILSAFNVDIGNQ